MNAKIEYLSYLSNIDRFFFRFFREVSIRIITQTMISMNNPGSSNTCISSSRKCKIFNNACKIFGDIFFCFDCFLPLDPLCHDLILLICYLQPLLIRFFCWIHVFKLRRVSMSLEPCSVGHLMSIHPLKPW